jgi:hypothetical protein
MNEATKMILKMEEKMLSWQQTQWWSKKKLTKIPEILLWKLISWSWKKGREKKNTSRSQEQLKKKFIYRTTPERFLLMKRISNLLFMFIAGWKKNSIVEGSFFSVWAKKSLNKCFQISRWCDLSKQEVYIIANYTLGNDRNKI